MTLTYWMPAESLEGARRLAYAVHARRLPLRAYYATEEAANDWAAKCNEHLRHPVRVYPIHIETRTTDDGRIPVARLGLGDVAAALLLVTLAPMAAAAGWGWLS